MKLGTKAALWHRLGEQQRVLTELIERQTATVEIATATGELLVAANEFAGDLGGLLVDLMADVADLAKRGDHTDIVERMMARASIAGELFKLQNERRKEERDE